MTDQQYAFSIGQAVFWRVGAQELKATVRYHSGPGRYGITLDDRKEAHSTTTTIWVGEDELRSTVVKMTMTDPKFAEVNISRGDLVWRVEMNLEADSEVAYITDSVSKDASFEIKLLGRGVATMDYFYTPGGAR